MTAPTHTPATAHTPDPAVIGEIDKPATLYAVYAAVVGLALVNVGLSSMGLGKFALPIQLAIGSIQAGIVGYYFMHLKQGDKIVILTALSSLFWMGILFVLFLSDYMTRHILLNP